MQEEAGIFSFDITDRLPVTFQVSFCNEPGLSNTIQRSLRRTLQRLIHFSTLQVQFRLLF